MAELPAEVIAVILSNLPAKSLLRFRCVSKPWCGLIDSPHFVNSHLNRAMGTNSNLNIILAYGNDLYSIEFDKLDRAVKLEHPLETTNNVKVLGNCNGLLSLSETEHQHIVLWNPSTREHRKLPVPPFEFPPNLPFAPLEFPPKIPLVAPYAPRRFGNCEFLVYGFGFDSLNNDYKLLRIVQFYDLYVDAVYSEVLIYSLKSNSWRRIENFPYYLRHEGVNGVLVNGALHWVVSQRPKSGNLIVAFDLGVEKYRLLPRSDHIGMRTLESDYHVYVRVLGGCLSLVRYYHGEVDIWVMKEYGVKESWTKLFSVELRSVFRTFDSVRPLGYSKSGGEVLLSHDNNRFLWFDLRSETIRKVWIHGVPNSFEADICSGSLVRLPGGSGRKKRQAQRDECKKGRDDFLSKGFKLVL